jgi:hypothetical protein
MSKEADHLLKWLGSLVKQTVEAQTERPAWLDDAEITVECESIDRRIWIKCADGSSMVVSVLKLAISTAERERLERERAEREASPEYQQEKREVAERMAQRAIEYHSEHEGPYSECNEPVCEHTRKWVERFGGEPLLLDDGDEPLN